jgi:hypothetical protein
MKKTDKFNYITGKQITDPGTGTRVYEIVGNRLPSVTTILGKTKDQEFLKNWKEKVGEAKAEEIKNLSSRRGTAMHKFLESYIESRLRGFNGYWSPGKTYGSEDHRDRFSAG